MTAGLFCLESQKIRDQDSLEQQEVVSGKYVYAGKKRCAKYQKFILIPDNASWYTAIRSEGLIKASYKIVKRLFCLNYILQKYHRPVRNVAMVCVAAVALGSSTYAWFVKNNKVDATTSTISAQSDAAYMTIKNGTSGASSVDTTSVTTTVATKPLYPATFGEEQGVTKGKFMTGYGTDLNDGSLKGNLKLVGTEEVIQMLQELIMHYSRISISALKARIWINFLLKKLKINQLRLQDLKCLFVFL